MLLFQLILVAIIQGVTEFLPVSSSGHLILLPELTKMDDQGLLIDVAVHVGSLFAVITYFWSDVKFALAGAGRLIRGRVDTRGAFLALCLALSTVPVAGIGLILHLTGLSEALRSIAVIGWATLLFGIFLYWADQTGQQDRTLERWTIRHAGLMGLWQALALIPGTSRSGITISAARQLGYARHDAAKLAMLMSIPTISASGLILFADLAAGSSMISLREATLAAFFAFLAAFCALGLMMRLLQTVSFTPYVIYRICLGITLLTIAYS